ncbi:Transmembrane_domain-containing protein [Hexamita inflata]|uniref:Transmembrane domain-containing protein n=1 Tax=Hexamita inflata TaxID=28002 RepID=A0AA86TJ98_9EUKA|nr:Transmembrane domain-containing protein [Hexamita inflata]
MLDWIGYIIGGVIAAYFILTFIIGLCIQSSAKSSSPEMFGEFPKCQIFLHVIISVFLVLACFINYIFGVFLGIGLFFYFIKLLSACCCLREQQAFQNQRSASETDAFLNQLRVKVPQASFYCECYHMKTVHYRDSNGKSHTRTEKVVTFRETRYVQILGMIDQTPALYIVGYSPLIYLKLKEQINWLGNSQMILDSLRSTIYLQNRHRDHSCSVSFRVSTPGLTPQNFLKRGEYPAWISQKMLWLSNLFQCDVLYICMMRSRIPKTQLPVIKQCSVDPTFQINQPVQQISIDQIQLPSFDQMCPTEIDQISLPPILEENTQPLLTDVKPPYFDNFDQITTPEYLVYHGNDVVQEQPTVQHEMLPAI